MGDILQQIQQMTLSNKRSDVINIIITDLKNLPAEAAEQIKLLEAKAFEQLIAI